MRWNRIPSALIVGCILLLLATTVRGQTTTTTVPSDDQAVASMLRDADAAIADANAQAAAANTPPPPPSNPQGGTGSLGYDPNFWYVTWHYVPSIHYRIEIRQDPSTIAKQGSPNFGGSMADSVLPSAAYRTGSGSRLAELRAKRAEEKQQAQLAKAAKAPFVKPASKSIRKKAAPIEP